MERNAILEQEVKFDAPIGLPLPDLRRLVGQTVGLPEQQLVTTYFDTVDRRLWGQGLTLRHRTADGHGDGLWTLKLPHASDGLALERTEVTWPGAVHEVPADARTVLRGVIRREPLRELTVLKTTRRRLELREAEEDEDHVVAELDDDTVNVVGGPRDGSRFRQVELEFHDQRWKSREVVRRLQRAGARVERAPKLARATGLPPPSPPSPRVDHRSTVADVLQASLRAGVDRMVARDWRMRLTTPAPTVDDVHQARVATRRLRSDLQTFGALLDPVWLRHARSDLKWCGTALGELRDADVLAERLTGAPLPIRQRLAVQRRASAQRLADLLASERYLNLVDRLHAGTERLPIAPGARLEAQRPAGEVLPSLVAARWRAVRRQVRRSGSHPSSAQLHRIRIKSQQLRYAAEAAAPIIGKPARRTAAAAENAQTVLGLHHDAVAAEDWLRCEWGGVDSPAGRRPNVAPAVSFEAGCLATEARQRQRKERRHWTQAWAVLRQPKVRRWLPTP
jgi:CHAD domain-containing protein